MGRFLDETLRDVAYAWRGLRKAPGLRRRRPRHPRARRRRQHRHLQRRQRAADPAAAVPRSAIASCSSGPIRPPRAIRARRSRVPSCRTSTSARSLFDGFGAIWATTAALTGENDPEQLRIGLVTTDFFSLLGAEAALGRTFRPATTPSAAADHDPAERRGLAAALRRRSRHRRPPHRRQRPADDRRRRDAGRLPADDAARRRGARRPRGVAAAQPALPRRPARAALPARHRPDAPGRRRRRGRRPTWRGSGAKSRRRTRSTARRDGSSRRCRCTSTPPATCGGRCWRSRSASAILLLIACVNVGSLLVARAAARARETAVKAALGASAGRLVRQHVVESLVLAAIGAGLGLLLGRWGLAAAAGRHARRARAGCAWPPLDVPVAVGLRHGHGAVDGAAGRRAGQRGAARQRRPGAAHGRPAGRRGRRRLRAALTVAQIALSVVLVLWRAAARPHGATRPAGGRRASESDGVLSFRVALPGSRYPNQDAFNAFSRRLQEALAALPGVTGGRGGQPRARTITCPTGAARISPPRAPMPRPRRRPTIARSRRA